jgi:hypothetical protein
VRAREFDAQADLLFRGKAFFNGLKELETGGRPGLDLVLVGFEVVAGDAVLFGTLVAEDDAGQVPRRVGHEERRFDGVIRPVLASGQKGRGHLSVATGDLRKLGQADPPLARSVLGGGIVPDGPLVLEVGEMALQ